MSLAPLSFRHFRNIVSRVRENNKTCDSCRFPWTSVFLFIHTFPFSFEERFPIHLCFLANILGSSKGVMSVRDKDKRSKKFVCTLASLPCMLLADDDMYLGQVFWTRSEGVLKNNWVFVLSFSTGARRGYKVHSQLTHLYLHFYLSLSLSVATWFLLVVVNVHQPQTYSQNFECTINCRWHTLSIVPLPFPQSQPGILYSNLKCGSSIARS